MTFTKRIAITCMLAGLISTGVSHAIEVYPIIKEINEDTPRENYVTVKSSFAAKSSIAAEKNAASQMYEFVTLELFRIPNPGDVKEKHIKELGSDNPALVYSPTKLVIPYGDERKVRIMPLRPVAHEQVYRLRIRPSYPEQALDKDKVRFAIGYDVLLRYLPSGKHTQGISLSCANGQWTLTATGNVRSELRNIVVDGHTAAPSFLNVYPGYARQLKVNKQLTFEMEGKQQTYEQCQRKE